MEDSENLSQVHERGSEVERYQKVRVLGEGSMGKAYLVRSAEDGLQYVMKRINIGHLEAKQREAALREAQLHSLLQHPNIVQFKELYQTTGDKLCIIMEFAEGGDLQEFIRSQNNKLLSESVVLNMFTQICLGLQEVHSKKIIHRDLKTANIFLSKDKQVKIGDFGISRTLDRTQLAATSMIGTPYYLSPQMVEGKPYSTKADIWALGVILYQLCSFKLPFDANSLPVLALKILKGAFPPIPNQYSKDLKALLLQMLCTDQKKRPSVETILSKPLLAKYIPLEEKAKLAAKQEQRIEAKKEREKKVEKVEKVEKGDDKDLKEKSKRQKEQKRQELRKQMREDLKKKRAQKQSDTTNLNVPDQPKQLKKSPRKDISITPKIEPNTKIKKQEIAKPWKTKKIAQKKDITIQIFAPQHKPQFVEPLKIDDVKTKPAKAQSSKQIEEGRRSMPLITEKVNNYHYSESRNRFVAEEQDQENEYPEEQIEEEEEEDQEFNEILNHVRNVEQLTRNLPKPSREVCLFEDSGNFQSTITAPQKQLPPSEQIQTLKHVISAESLEELRLILENNLGDNRFREAYSVVKEHIDSYYQQLKYTEDRQRLKRQYVYNQEILKDKLNFLTADQRKRNLELLFTLVMFEEIELQRNNEDIPSRYEHLL